MDEKYMYYVHTFYESYIKEEDKEEDTTREDWTPLGIVSPTNIQTYKQTKQSDLSLLLLKHAIRLSKKLEFLFFDFKI